MRFGMYSALEIGKVEFMEIIIMKKLINKSLALLMLTGVFLLEGCASTSNSQSLGEVIDDSVITTKVKSELAASEQTSAYEIQVETFKGVVQLSGFVDTLAEKQAASRITRDVIGVKDVENDLIIK